MLIPAALTQPIALASMPGRSSASVTARSDARCGGTASPSTPESYFLRRTRLHRLAHFWNLVEQELEHARCGVAFGDGWRQVPHPEQGGREDHPPPVEDERQAAMR